MPDEQPYDLTVVNEAPYDLVVEDGAYTLTLSGLGAQGIPGPAIATELEVTVRNQSGEPMTKGTIVYLSGSTGQRPLITKAQANNDANSAQTIGFLKDTINNNADGVVIVSGLLENIDTQGLGDGTQLYLSPTTAGTWTTTKPSAPNHLVYVGIVVKAHITQGVIYVSVQNGYELNELHDVAISSPATGQFLKRNAGNTLWVNSSIVSADVTDATDANTPSTIVKRNPAGGFSAGAVEAEGLAVGAHQVNGFGLSKGNRSLNFPNASATTPQTILIPESGGTLALTSDPRFTDARTPLAHTHFSADITDASPSNGAYTIVKRDGDGSAAFSAVTADYLGGSTEVLAGGYGNGMGLYSDGIRFYANDVQSLLQTAAINSTSQTYTLPDASGTIVLDVDLGTIASKNYTQSSTPPASPAQGDQWLDTSTGMKFEYDGTFWVDVAGAAVTQNNVRLALASGSNVQLPATQAATDANSAMTRGLADARYSHAIADFDYSSNTVGASGGSGVWTWTPPATAKLLRITCVAGGSGGGSGRCGASGSDRSGGGGGSSGPITIVDMPTSFLSGGALTVTVGAGGAGGPAITSNDTNGADGSTGGDTTVADGSTTIAVAANNSSSVPRGKGGSTTSGASGTASYSFWGIYSPTAGSAGSNTSGTAKSVTSFADGGAGGGGLNTSNAIGRGGINGVARAGNIWGQISFASQSISPVAGVDGGSGTAGSIDTRVPVGASGVGGNGGLTVKGGNGTAGVRGGGGGGGGAGTNGTGGSGAGGAGGNGFVRIEIIN